MSAVGASPLNDAAGHIEFGVVPQHNRAAEHPHIHSYSAAAINKAIL